MTKKGVRSVLLVLMVGTLLVFCGTGHALASSYNALTYNARGDLAVLSSSSSGPQTFTYDTLRRLVSSTDATGYQVQYAYDAGSRLTSETTPSGTATFAWDLLDPATNRLLTMTVPGGSTDTWTYDAAGNPLTRSRSQNGTTQVSSYTWDAAGKLSSVIRQGQTTLTFAYAPDGTLSRKEQGTQVTTYTYDFAGVSRESTTSSTPITYQHNGAGELVSLTWNNQTYYYHFNAHGDTIALSDSTGTPIAEYSYDPWGTLTTNTNPSLPNPYLYCGAYGVRWDADLSLYLMGARWYNPSTGRFLTKDSYPPDLLAPITQNPYQYCGNNPVKNIDPEGHEAIVAASVWGLVGAAGFVLSPVIALGIAAVFVGSMALGRSLANRQGQTSQQANLWEHLNKLFGVDEQHSPNDPNDNWHKHLVEIGHRALDVVRAVRSTVGKNMANGFLKIGLNAEALTLLKQELQSVLTFLDTKVETGLKAFQYINELIDLIKKTPGGGK